MTDLTKEQKDAIKAELSPITDSELHERYDESLDSEDLITICGLTYLPSQALKAVDPIAYRCGFVDWIDSEVGETITDEIDGEHYGLSAVEECLDALADRPSLADIKQDGYDRGHSIASYQDLPELGSKVDRSIDWVGVGDTIGSVEDAQEYFMALCSAAEENNRSYSPFEFTAKEINDRPDSDEAWEAFSEGINEGFASSWEKRSKDFYSEET